MQTVIFYLWIDDKHWIKCIKKDFIHEIVHVCPVHTRIVNNHIYKHTYVPEYTCSEENVCTNVDDNCCKKF